MKNKKSKLLWWLCMLLPFTIVEILFVQWLQDVSQTKFLWYAVSYLIAGVVCGGFVVAHSLTVTDAQNPGANSKTQVLPDVAESAKKALLAKLETKISEASAEASKDGLACAKLEASRQQVVNSSASGMNVKDSAAQNVNTIGSSLNFAPASYEEEFCWHREKEDNQDKARLVLGEDEGRDAAIQGCEKTDAIDPQNFEAWFKKGVVLREQGHYEEALYCLNYALSFDPKNILVMNEKAECLVFLGRKERGFKWFEKALSYNEKSLSTLLSKARCLSFVGRHQDAIYCCEQALGFEPKNMEVLKAKEEYATKWAAAHS